MATSTDAIRAGSPVNALVGWVTLGVLGLTVALPSLVFSADPMLWVVLLACGALPVAGAARGVLRRRSPSSDRPRGAGRLRPMTDMVLHLSPVALLTLVFPIASDHIALAQVGGVNLTTLLLASSLTVPWMSQAVCLPLYRAIGPLIIERDMVKINRRFVQVWPTVFVQSLAAVVLFAVPVQLIMGWSFTALSTYLALCVLHLAFAQSLIVTNVGRRKIQWAGAWAGYAAALFLFPTVWFLPPVVGLISQLIPMRRYLALMRKPVWLDRRDVAGDLGRGLLLGSVLWADKLMWFLASDGVFEVSTVFLALLPAVLAYNYYFVRLAPGFDDSVGAVRTAMTDEPNHVLARHSDRLSNVVTSSIARTAFVGAVLGLVVTLLIGIRTPDSVGLVATVSVASWFFMMTTVLCYKLDYVGERSQAQLISAVHLMVTTAAFLLLPAGAGLYGWLIVLEAVVFVAALRACLSHWRTAEYALFWRHATAW